MGGAANLSSWVASIHLFRLPAFDHRNKLTRLKYQLVTPGIQSRVATTNDFNVESILINQDIIDSDE